MSDDEDCGLCGHIYIDPRCEEHGSLLAPEPPHEASAVPFPNRLLGHPAFGKWRGKCSCGWHSWWTSKQEAQSLAEAHSERRMR